MPIIDIELIVSGPESIPDGLAAQLADALGEIFDSPPGGTRVRLRPLSRRLYAENATAIPDGWQSIFVTVLKEGRSPSATQWETHRLSAAVARICGRHPRNVHVLYQLEPEGHFESKLDGRH